MRVIIVVIAFIMDLILGDPEAILHPVVIIGKLISLLEKFLRRIFPKTGEGEKAGGVILMVLTVTISAGVPLMILIGLRKILLAIGAPVILATIIELIWCWQLLAAKSLKDAALQVYEQIKTGDITKARAALSMIVGRDTAELSMEEITKGVVETVAENTSDGVIAPMMYMLIGGAPLAFAYKAVNTLDSMVGYKNEKYINLGRASAKMDDLLNFIPARLTALLMVWACGRAGDEEHGDEKVYPLNSKRAMAIWRRDWNKHISPNSGNPESACAGALGIQLGGDAYYFGKLVKKETMGDSEREVCPGDILRSCDLMLWSSIYGLALMGALGLLAIWIIK